jgi:hypothetical protein
MSRVHVGSAGLIRWWCCFFGVLLLGSVLHAFPVVIKLEGTVTTIFEVTPVVKDIVEVGDPVAAVYVYNTETKDTNDLANEADYWHATIPYGISAQAGDLVMATNWAGFNPKKFLLQLWNNAGQPVQDVYYVRSDYNTHNLADYLENPPTFERTGIQWKLVGKTTNALTSTDLFVDPPNLAVFNQPDGFLMFGVITQTDYFMVTSTIASATRITALTSIADGDWEIFLNWDLGFYPVEGLDAVIDNNAIYVWQYDAAASSVTVRGAKGALVVYDQGTVTLTNDLNVEGGQLVVAGIVDVGGSMSTTPGSLVWGSGGYAITTVGGITNGGEIDLGAYSLYLEGGPITNSGVIRGFGRVEVPITNEAGGEIRGESGQLTQFTGAQNTNAGAIYLGNGSLEFYGSLANESTGLIAGRGELRVKGGLTNRGSIALSGGFSDVYGDLVNEGAGSRIIITGASITTFFDDVSTDGTVQIGAECGAVFLGSLSGTGGTSGPGTAYIEGDLRPGNSPATVSFGGSVMLGPTANLEIELGGTTPGSEFDVIKIAGTAALDGTLRVKLINGFVPKLGDAFSILTCNSRTGDFGKYLGLDLGGGLALEPGFDAAGTLTLTVTESTGARFTRGNVNADDRLNIADAVYILTYLFRQGTPPSCMDATDTNDDGKVNIADAVYLLTYLFRSGDPLFPPFSECGVDPTTDDQLDCASFPPCGP